MPERIISGIIRPVRLSRISCLWLAMLFILSLAACQLSPDPGPDQPSPTPVPAETYPPETEPDLTQPPLYRSRPDLPSGPLRLWWPEGEMPNPLLADDRATRAAYDLIFQSLYRIGPERQLQPVLIYSLTDPMQTRQVDLVLRYGSRFHDGRFLTAEDVAACIRFILDHPEQSPYAAALSRITTVEVLETSQLRLELSEPDPWLAYALVFPIVPAGYLSDRESGLIPGTGPYRMAEQRQDQVLVLERDLPGGSISDLRRIELLPYPDLHAALQGFFADEIDLVFLSPALYQQYLPRISLRFQPYPGSQLVLLSYQTGRQEMLGQVQHLLYLKQLLQQTYFQQEGHLLGEIVSVPLLPDSYPLGDQAVQVDVILERLAAAEETSPVWPAGSQPLQLIWPDHDPARAILAAEIGALLDVARISWSGQALAAEAFQSAVSSGRYDLALLEVRLPAKPDPGWLYLPWAENSLYQVSGFDPGMNHEMLDYPVWQDLLEQTWHRRSPGQLLTAVDLANILGHTAARSPWDSLLIRHEALLYGDRVIGQARPNTYYPYEGIDALWVWSSQ